MHSTVGLPPGENIIHIRVSGDARYRHGLTRVIVGPSRVMRPQYYEPRYDLQVTSIAAFGATLLLAGLLTLMVWHGGRRDPLLFWFGIVALTWSLCTFLMVWPPQLKTEPMQHLLLYSVRHIYTVPLLVLCLRAGNVRNHWLEGTLWSLFAVGALLAALLDAEHYVMLATVSWALFLALCIGFFGWLLWVRFQARESPEQQRNAANTGPLSFRMRERSVYFLPVTLAVVIGFTGHDWARWMGYADYDNLLLTPFAMPFLILALGATIIDRHLQAAHALARSNVELEQRVAEKADELEQAYERMQVTEREQAVLRERQRIMGDMHDGLSANLVSLHNMVQSKSTDSVEELLVLPDLKPERIFNIQRIVLEALTNALRHAAARTISVSARAVADRDVIVIAIADDGAGFDLANTSGGRGLRSMRDRAARIGIALDIHSQPGQGTTVVLELPITRG